MTSTKPYRTDKEAKVDPKDIDEETLEEKKRKKEEERLLA